MPGPIRPDGILQPARVRPEPAPITPAPAQGQMTPEQQMQMFMALLMMMGGGGMGGMAPEAAGLQAAPMPLPTGLPNG